MSTGTNDATDVDEESTRRSGKSDSAFRTISEVSADLNVPQHVLRFWETKFSQIRPMKRGGGRRYYRPEDVALLAAIRDLLYNDGYTIKGAQKLLRENGIKTVITQTEGGRERLGLPDGEGDGAETVSADYAEPVEDREPSFSFDGPPKKTAEAPPTQVELEPEPEPEPEEVTTDVEDPELEEGVIEEKVAEETSPVSYDGEDEDESIVLGLSDDQRLELEVVLSDLEDLRRILSQAGL